jgi:hypothetical protein
VAVKRVKVAEVDLLQDGQRRRRGGALETDRARAEEQRASEQRVEHRAPYQSFFSDHTLSLPLPPSLAVSLSRQVPVGVRLDSGEVDEAVCAVALHRHDGQIPTQMAGIVSADWEPIAQPSQRGRAIEVRDTIDVVAHHEVVQVFGLCCGEEIGPDLLHVRATDSPALV